MINGKYVATVTIEMSVAEDVPDLLSFEEIAKNWTHFEDALTNTLKRGLWAGDDDIQATVKVETHSCYVERTEEGAG